MKNPNNSNLSPDAPSPLSSSATGCLIWALSHPFRVSEIIICYEVDMVLALNQIQVHVKPLEGTTSSL